METQDMQDTGLSKSTMKSLKSSRPNINDAPERGTNRYAREGESRESNGRESEYREIDFLDRKGSLFIDPNLAPDGFTFGWCTTHSGGKPLPHFLTSAMRRGWDIVMASEFYSLANRNDKVRSAVMNVFKSTSDDYVREGDNILLIRPTALHKAEQDFYNKRQQDRRNIGKEAGLRTQTDDVTYGAMDYTPIRPGSSIF